MYRLPVKVRRARRTDFVAVMKVLASNGLPVPPPDRRTLRRFRRIVADLGVDFYVAVTQEQVIGFVHVTYARQIASAPRARIEALAVRADRQRRGVGAALLEKACARAGRRGCKELSCAVADADEGLTAFLCGKGWSGAGRLLRTELPCEPAHP